jgi:hypothetical protein
MVSKRPEYYELGVRSKPIWGYLTIVLIIIVAVGGGIWCMADSGRLTNIVEEEGNYNPTIIDTVSEEERVIDKSIGSTFQISLSTNRVAPYINNGSWFVISLDKTRLQYYNYEFDFEHCIFTFKVLNYGDSDIVFRTICLDKTYHYLTVHIISLIPLGGG